MRYMVGTKIFAIAAAFALLALVCAADAKSFKYIYSFCADQGNCTDGTSPSGELLLGPDGTIYGSTTGDGAHGGGNVFALVPKDGGYDHKALYDFCAEQSCTDGYDPRGQLVIDIDGNLYGTTEVGGIHNVGVVFKLVHNKAKTRWRMEKLFEFCPDFTCATGKYPSGGLVYAGQASGVPYDGVSPLYGTTQGDINQGTSVLYSLTKVRGTSMRKEHVLYQFCPRPDCGWSDDPEGLIDGGGGSFFGAATSNATAGYAFQLVPDGAKFRLIDLYDFCQLDQCADGTKPTSVTRLGDGDLAGVTYLGGAYGNGSIFKLTNEGGVWHQKVLHDFCQDPPLCNDGGMPSGTLTLSSDGSLLGPTTSGGKCMKGTLFALRPKSFKVLHNFCRADRDSNTHLLIDPQGNLFGTVAQGGKIGFGAVFELTP